MGHLVNANAFRLGYSKKWTSSWIEESKLYKQYLQEDFIIFRFIKLFFTQYSIPLFNSTYKRNNRDKKKKHERFWKSLYKSKPICGLYIYIFPC